MLTVNSRLQGVKDVTFSSFYSVLPGLNNDIIVGLPTLLCELIDLYVARILSANTLRPSVQMVSESIHSISTVSKVKSSAQSIKRGQGLRQKFIAHGDDKPIYPDGDSEEEVDDALLDSTLPLAKRLSKP